MRARGNIWCQSTLSLLVLSSAGYRVYFSAELSSTGLFWGMRSIPDLKMYLVKAAAGATKELNLLFHGYQAAVAQAAGPELPVCVL